MTYKAGFLMTVEASDPLTDLSQTCYSFITNGYDTVMTDVLYGRTAKYQINGASNIAYSKLTSN